MFKRINRREQYKDKFITIFSDTVVVDDDMTTKYHVIHYDQTSVISVVKKGECFLMVHSPRYIVNDVQIEFPAGKIEAGENPIEAAVREPFEETSIKVCNSRLVHEYYPSFGHSDEKVYIVFSDYQEGTEHPQELETIDVKWYTKEQIVDMARAGKITNGLTLSALLYILIAQSD